MFRTHDENLTQPHNTSNQEDMAPILSPPAHTRNRKSLSIQNSQSQNFGSSIRDYLNKTIISPKLKNPQYKFASSRNRENPVSAVISPITNPNRYNNNYMDLLQFTNSKNQSSKIKPRVNYNTLNNKDTIVEYENWKTNSNIGSSFYSESGKFGSNSKSFINPIGSSKFSYGTGIDYNTFYRSESSCLNASDFFIKNKSFLDDISKTSAYTIQHQLKFEEDINIINKNERSKVGLNSVLNDSTNKFSKHKHSNSFNFHLLEQENQFLKIGKVKVLEEHILKSMTMLKNTYQRYKVSKYNKEFPLKVKVFSKNAIVEIAVSFTSSDPTRAKNDHITQDEFIILE